MFEEFFIFIFGIFFKRNCIYIILFFGIIIDLIMLKIFLINVLKKVEWILEELCFVLWLCDINKKLVGFFIVVLFL